MKAQKIKKQNIREQILNSAIKSFKIEGINISLKKARATLKLVEINLGK